MAKKRRAKVDEDFVLSDPEIRATLRKFCRENGLDIDNLPNGMTPADLLDRMPRTNTDGTAAPWWVEYEAIRRGDQKRPVGAPRKGDPPIAWAEIDTLLVTGVLTEEGRVYPTVTELAERFKVSRAAIAKYISKNNVEIRRQRFAEKSVEAQQEAAIAVDVARVVSTREKARVAVDLYLEGFIDALKKGRVATNNVDDLDKIVRILDRLDGGADKVVENRHSLTLETIQSRFEGLKGKIAKQEPVGIAPPNKRAQLPISVQSRQDAVVDVEAEEAS